MFAVCLLTVLSFFFTSCENFLNGSDVRDEIIDTIAYNNAKEITVLIQPEEGTGSTVPSGNHKAKQGYDFEVNFTENPAYSFAKWIAVAKDNPSQIITSGVSFEDAASSVTKVKISNDSTSIRLIPFCEQRIAVSGEPSPRYDPLGVSRDRSISVSFTKPLSEESFIFAETEIPSGASLKKDENGKIWAYVYENQTYLKNISITNIDDYSIADYFTKPEVNGKLLTINVDKTNPIQFNSGEIFKTVKVTLSAAITDTSGIKMNATKSWNYQITEATDEKATVILTSVAAEGSVYLAGTKAYSLGQKITLAFTEDADYQFVKWDYDSAIIYIEDPKLLNTIAVVREKTTEENPTQIKAVCAPRLRVTSFAPVNSNEEPTVSKNSSIVIQFSQNLPVDEAGLAQLENIAVTVGGSPVKSSFKAPEIKNNIVTYITDKSNMLDVPAGQTKTVSVSIPADFYYQLEDGTKVTYGANGKNFDYKIDSTTMEKAEITFAANTGSGTLSPAAGTKQYSLGQEIPLIFTPADGWQFNGWEITSGNESVAENKIKIADKKALSTKLIVYEALQGVSVTANVSEKLKITEKTPAAAMNPKDSDITIIFNKALASECSSLLDEIAVSLDGVNVDSSFGTRSINGKTITLKNTKHLSVDEGTLKNVTVTIPSAFYYMDGSVKVNLEKDYTFNYVTDSSSIAMAEVTFKQTANAGTVSPQNESLQHYCLDKEVPVSFAPANGWQFNGWSITSGGQPVPESKIKIADKNTTSTKLIIYEAVKDVVVKADASETLSVSTTTPSSETNPKDSSITISFNKSLDASCANLLNKIKISLDGTNVDSSFATRQLSTNKITITNTKYLNVTGTEKKTVTVTVPTDFFYKDIANNVNVHLPEPFVFEFDVNSVTNSKTSVTYEVPLSGSGTINQGSSKDYDVGATVNLAFSINEGYQFNGWVITGANGNEPSEEIIKIENKKSTSTTMTVYQKVAGITVKASASRKLAVSSVTPTSSTSNPSTKDSSITITFNKNLSFASTTEKTALLNSICVSVDGNGVDNNFTNRTCNANTITLTNTNYLSVADGLQKTVTVTVPSTFYYMDGSVKVNLEQNYSFNYVVNSTSTAQTKVTFLTVTNSGTTSPAAGSTVYSYSLGKEIPISFEPANGWEFKGWTLKDSSGNDISKSKIKIENPNASSTKLIIYETVSGVKVKANAILLPKVESFTPSYVTGGVNCDTPFVITFNKAMKKDNFKLCKPDNRNLGIQIINPSNENEYYEEYFTATWNTEGTTLTIKPENTIYDAIVKNDGEVKNIRIAFDTTKATDTDGNKLKEADTAFVYRINHNTETDEPEVRMNLKKPIYNLGVETSERKAISDNIFEDSGFSDGETYSLNHVGQKIYFDATITDEGSGYKKLTVNETLICTVDGTKVEQKCAPKEYTDASFSNEPYILQSKYDGVVKLEFIFEDYAGNPTTKTYYVIKDTTLDSSTVFKLAAKSYSYTTNTIKERGKSTELNHPYFNRFWESKSKILFDSFKTFKDGGITKVTQTIDYSNADEKFFGENQSSISVSIKFGYSKDSITNDAQETEEGSRIFTFAHDADKDCFLKITGYDEVGNYKEIIRVIPRRVSIFSTQKELISTWTVNGITINETIERIMYKESDILKQLVNTYNANSCKSRLFYTYRQSESSNDSGYVYVSKNYDLNQFHLEDLNCSDEDLTPNGIYTFYVQPCYEYSEGSYYGALSEPYVYYHNTGTGNTSSGTPTFPESITYSKGSIVMGTGMRDITVSSNFSKKAGFTYGVRYNKQGEGAYDYRYADFTFSVQSGEKYDLKIFAKDNATGQITESSASRTIDLTSDADDNLPPSHKADPSSTSNLISFNYTSHYRNVYDYMPRDSGVGLQENNGYVEFNYYLTKKNTVDTLYDDIKRENLSSIPLKGTVRYLSTSNQLDFEWPTFVESCYVLTLDLKDKNGNSYLSNCVVSNRVKPRYGNNITYTYRTESADGKPYVLKSNKSGLNGQFRQLSDGNYWNNTISQGTASTKGFIRFDPYEGTQYSKESRLTFNLVQYACLEYLIKEKADDLPDINSKSVIPGLGGAYQVYYDAPCFAHTMAFPTDMLGDLDAKLAEAKTIDSSIDDETYIKAIWETKGREYGLKLINSAWLDSTSTATYTAPVSEIPSGYSYVTVFHFADGTSVMSEVKKK